MVHFREQCFFMIQVGKEATGPVHKNCPGIEHVQYYVKCNTNANHCFFYNPYLCWCTGKIGLKQYLCYEDTLSCETQEQSTWTEYKLTKFSWISEVMAKVTVKGKSIEVLLFLIKTV